MEFLRNKKHSVFTVIIFSFIILTFILWGGQHNERLSPTALTSVNGEEIPYKDFQRIVARQMQMFGQLSGGKNAQNEYFLKLIEQRAAQDLIARKVLAQKAKTLGIKVGAPEILAVLEKEQAFHDPNLKRFSPSVYQAVLQANDLRPVDFEAAIQEDLLNEKIRTMVEQSLSVSSAEILDAYRLEKTKCTLESATFDPIKLVSEKKIAPSSADVQKYFEAHKQELRGNEKRNFEVAVLDPTTLMTKVVLTEKDVADYYETKLKNSKENPLGTGPQAHALHILISNTSKEGEQKARDILKKIRTEADFRRLAQTESEDFSNASQGGDLGYFSETTMVKAFSDAVFAKTTSLGRALGPVKTNYGYHLIWIIDRTPSEVSLASRKNQVRYLLQKEKAQSLMAEIKTELEKAKGKPESILLTKGFNISKTGFIEAKERSPSIPFVLLQNAFKAPLNEWKGPEEVGQKLYLYKTLNIEEPKLLSLNEAKPLIEKRLESDLTEALVKSLYLGLVDKTKEWSALAKAGAQIQSSKDFSPYTATQVPNFGESEVLLKAVQGLSASNSITSYYAYEGKWVFFRASQWTSIPEAVPEADAQRIKDEILSRKKVQILGDLTQSLIKSAKIPKDFRAKYSI